jgi:hypothetical protein
MMLKQLKHKSNKPFQWLLLLVTSTLILSCGGKKFEKTPVDNYIVEYSKEQNFAILLQDMDVDGNFFKTYKHKYQVILEDEEGKPSEKTGEWVEVGEKYFAANENNLGMTLVYKKDGKLEKNVSPSGVQYVGDKKYGEWRSNNGTSVWAFYGQYMFMSHMFGMMRTPFYRNNYNTYRGSHYGRSGYYGPTANGKSTYGTNSAATRKARPDFHQRRASKSGWGSSRGRSGVGSRGSGFGK